MASSSGLYLVLLVIGLFVVKSARPVSYDEDFQFFRPEDDPADPVETERVEQTIEDCVPYPNWMLVFLNCASPFPRDAFPESEELDTLFESLGVTEMDTGFYYVAKKASANFYAMYFGSTERIQLKLYYYSTVDFDLIPNLISLEGDDNNRITKSEGNDWTIRSFQIDDNNQRVFFDVSLTKEVHTENDFFLLDRIEITYAKDEPVTTTEGPGASPETETPDTPEPGTEEPDTPRPETDEPTETTTSIQTLEPWTSTGAPTEFPEPSTSPEAPTETPEPSTWSTYTEASTETLGPEPSTSTEGPVKTPEPSTWSTSATVTPSTPEGASSTSPPSPTDNPGDPSTTTPGNGPEPTGDPETTTTEESSTPSGEESSGLGAWEIALISVSGSVALVGAAAAGGIYYFKTHSPGGGRKHARLHDDDFEWNDSENVGQQNEGYNYSDNPGYTESVPAASVYNYNYSAPSNVLYTGDPNPVPGHILPRLTKIS